MREQTALRARGREMLFYSGDSLSAASFTLGVEPMIGTARVGGMVGNFAPGVGVERELRSPAGQTESRRPKQRTT